MFFVFYPPFVTYRTLSNYKYYIGDSGTDRREILHQGSRIRSVRILFVKDTYVRYIYNVFYFSVRKQE